MQNLVFTQLSVAEVRTLIHEALSDYFKENQSPKTSTAADIDEIGGLELAVEITGYSPATIYSKTSRREMPHSKKSKRLYFSRNELIEWIRSGKRQTREEMDAL